MIKDQATRQRMMLYLNSTKGNGENMTRASVQYSKRIIVPVLLYFMIKLLLKSTYRIEH